MKRNLKALGLAFVAALALSAVAASAASAQQAQGTVIHPESYPAVITAEHENKDKITTDENDNYLQATPGSTKSECHVATYTAKVAAASNEVTVTPHYAQCNVGVELNGCHFKFKIGTAIVGGAVGTVDIVCPPNQSITVNGPAGICQVHIPAQTGLTTGATGHGVTFTNKPADPANGTPTPWVTIDVHIDNITYTDTDNSFFCPFAGNTEAKNGTFTSTIVAKAYKWTSDETTPHTNTTTPTVTHYKHNNNDVGLHVK